MLIAAITGAAQGIGRRTAEVLAERGYALALMDLQAPTATAAAARAGGTPEAPLEFIGDVSSPEAVAGFAAAVEARWGHADVLVNNAGISFIQPAEQVAVADLRRVLEVNLVGPFLLSQAFGAQMLRRATGSIINVASVAGLQGISHRAAYNASKHGLIGLTRTLAGEWGARGVRSNAVCPGWVKTEMDHSAQGAGLYTDDDITGRVPMARFAFPDDVARAIAFLADPVESSFINGQTLAVDGGWTADGSWQSLRLATRPRSD
ncbi:MAG TPA: SDR family oxidoreductase [Terriglobales bacterium]|nr:SDR family oxidoreductase [Terriglobales bacterium]